MHTRPIIPALAALLLGWTVPASDIAEAGRYQAGGATPGGAREVVDFSRPPAAGVTFRLEEEGEYDRAGTVTEAGGQPRSITQRIRAHLALVQSIRAVEQGRVTRLERDYEDFRFRVENRGVDESGKETTREWDQEHPLHGARVRASWTGDRLALEERKDAGWAPASAPLAARLSTMKLLHPILPVPPGVKRVGDRWSLDEKVLADLFSDALDGSPDAVKIEGRGDVAFTGIAAQPSGRVAVLVFGFDVKVEIPDHPGYRFRLEGTSHYNLERRMVVSLDAKGTMLIRGEFEREGRKRALDLSGTIRTRSWVTFLPHADAAPPEPRK